MRLEEAFAARHDVAHAVAVSSGTAALEIALRALAGRDNGEGDGGSGTGGLGGRSGIGV